MRIVLVFAVKRSLPGPAKCDGFPAAGAHSSGTNFVCEILMAKINGFEKYSLIS